MKKLSLILIAFVFIAFSTNLNAQHKLNKIIRSGVLKVGMTGEQPPFNMEAKDGSLIGYEVDLAEMLAESMRLELKLVRLPFNELLPALEDGDIDIIMSGMTITMERNLKVAFIGPYMLSGKSILTKMESLARADEVEDLNLSQLKVSSLKGSTSQEFVEVLIPEAKSLPAESYDEAVDMLLAGEANVMVADYPICVWTILRNPQENLITLEEPLTLEPIGMALPPNDPLLLNFVENYFTALDMAGILTELELYWFESGTWLDEVK